MVTSAVVVVSNWVQLPCILVASLTVHNLEPLRKASAPSVPKKWPSWSIPSTRCISPLSPNLSTTLHTRIAGLPDDEMPSHRDHLLISMLHGGYEQAVPVEGIDSKEVSTRLRR